MTDRTTGGYPEKRDLNAKVLDGLDGDNVGWQQQQLLPETGGAASRADRPNDRLRRAGLVGIAQAREALAEAARRAKAREESQAA